MIDHNEIQFFLGANTPEGYHSLASQLLPTEKAKAIYILKGGLASSKSQFLDQLSAEARARNTPYYQLLSPQDPNILEGLLFPQQEIAVTHGNHPHNADGTYLGLIEHYVNLGDCYHKSDLQTQRDAILQATKEYKESCAHITPCLSAAGELGETILSLLSTPKLAERLTKRANGILNREVKSKFPKETGRLSQCFLSANTNQGRIALYHSATHLCDKVYQLWDNYGIAHGILLPLLTGAVNRGYHVLACLNPMNPKRLEHLIIPELSLCFLTTSPNSPLEKDCFRKIRLETMLDGGLLKQNRSRLRVYRKMYHSLLEELGHLLADNQILYKQLDSIYKPFVDTAQISQVTAQIGMEIFGDTPTCF